jgi:hypothetical protein
MSWFQHTTYANRDEKLAALRSIAGFEGYGFYWFLVETIADSMQNSGQCSVKYPLKVWQRLTGLYPNKLKRLVNVLTNIGLCSANVLPITEQSSEELLEISLPNILKYIKTPKNKQKTEIKNTSLEERRGEERREEKKEEGEGAEAPRPPDPEIQPAKKNYAFEGKIIRLTSKNLAEWKVSFSAIPDLKAALIAKDAYLQSLPPDHKNRGNWFLFCSNQLAREHQEYLAKRAFQPIPRYSETKTNLAVY